MIVSNISLCVFVFFCGTVIILKNSIQFIYILIIDPTVINCVDELMKRQRGDNNKLCAKQLFDQIHKHHYQVHKEHEGLKSLAKNEEDQCNHAILNVIRFKRKKENLYSSYFIKRSTKHQRQEIREVIDRSIQSYNIEYGERYRKWHIIDNIVNHHEKEEMREARTRFENSFNVQKMIVKMGKI